MKTRSQRLSLSRSGSSAGLESSGTGMHPDTLKSKSRHVAARQHSATAVGEPSRFRTLTMKTPTDQSRQSASMEKENASTISSANERSSTPRRHRRRRNSDDADDASEEHGTRKRRKVTMPDANGDESEGHGVQPKKNRVRVHGLEVKIRQLLSDADASEKRRIALSKEFKAVATQVKMYRMNEILRSRFRDWPTVYEADVPYEQE